MKQTATKASWPQRPIVIGFREFFLIGHMAVVLVVYDAKSELSIFHQWLACLHVPFSDRNCQPCPPGKTRGRRPFLAEQPACSLHRQLSLQNWRNQLTFQTLSVHLCRHHLDKLVVSPVFGPHDWRLLFQPIDWHHSEVPGPDQVRIESPWGLQTKQLHFVGYFPVPRRTTWPLVEQIVVFRSQGRSDRPVWSTSRFASFSSLRLAST
mmetsp:Transcript_21742/g.40580  ORF Transcript_21742/g.40580 Transcript_21742/m.40580 type:complete len:208 (+) Transcript_21742:109-732(+)